MSRHGDDGMQLIQGRSNSFSSSSAPYQPMSNNQPAEYEPLPNHYAAASSIYTAYPTTTTTADSSTDQVSAQPILLASAPSSQSDFSADKGVTIRLRTLAGQVMSLSFPTLVGVSVVDIKQKLEQTNNIPVSFQRLIFGGREMADHELVTSYGMEDGAMVHLLLHRQNLPDGEHPPDTSHAEQMIFNGVSIPVAPVAGGRDRLHEANDDDNGMGILTADFHTRVMIRSSRAIKIISLMDFIWVLVLATRIFPYFFAGSVLLVCGYAGAHYYRRDFIGAFLIYLICSLGFRIYVMVTLDDLTSYVLVAMGILLDCWLLRLSMTFLRLIWTLTPVERQELLALSRPPGGMAWGAPRIY